MEMICRTYIFFVINLYHPRQGFISNLETPMPLCPAIEREKIYFGLTVFQTSKGSVWGVFGLPIIHPLFVCLSFFNPYPPMQEVQVNLLQVCNTHVYNKY